MRMDGRPHAWRHLSRLPGLGLAAAVSLAACGGDWQQSPGNAPKAAPPAPAATEAPRAVGALFAFSGQTEGPMPKAGAADGRRFFITPMLGRIAALRNGDRFEVPLPDNQVLSLTVTAREEHMGRIVSITGALADGQPVRAQITVSGPAVSGTITVGRTTWTLRTDASGTTLQDLGAAGVREADPHTPGDFEQHKRALPQLDLPALPRAAPSSAAPGKAASAQAPATLDLVAIGDRAFQQLMGSESAELAEVGSLVAQANQAFADSGAFVRIRLTGYARVAGSYAGATLQTLYTDLTNFGSHFSGAWTYAVAGGADVVAAFTQYDAAKGSTCGLGTLGRPSAQGVFSGNKAGASVVAVSRGTRTSDNSTCSNYTLAHEIGHNLGSMHDRANSDQAGAYDYSYGWGVSGVWGDIMSYLRPRLPYFSNPAVRLCAGGPCGTPTDDAVRTFNNTSPELAGAMDPQSRLSGWYWDSAASGTGWAIEVRNGRMFAAAFVFDDAGNPTWVSGSGAPCASRPATWCLGLDEFEGGQTLTGAYKAPRLKRRVADVELDFSDGYPATLQMRLAGVARNLTRFQFAGNQALASKPAYPGAAVAGWYWKSDAGGTGVFMERQGDQVFLALFHYRADGSATWTTAAGRNYDVIQYSNGSRSWTTALMKMERYSGGQTLTGPYRQPQLANAQEAQGYLAMDNGYFSVFNSSGTRGPETWTRFNF